MPALRFSWYHSLCYERRALGPLRAPGPSNRGSNTADRLDADAAVTLAGFWAFADFRERASRRRRPFPLQSASVSESEAASSSFDRQIGPDSVFCSAPSPRPVVACFVAARAYLP